MLPGFPRQAEPMPPLSDELRSLGIALRPARTADLPFLRTLYASFRMAELALIPWSPAQKLAFLNDQFRLQHLHFTQFYAKSDFWLIVQTHPTGKAQPIGRLYLDRSRSDWLIVDIGLLPEARRHGLGSALLDWIKTAATAAGAEGLALQVAANNPAARALYLRKGFADAGAAQALHQPMRWPVPADTPQLNTA